MPAQRLGAGRGRRISRDNRRSRQPFWNRRKSEIGSKRSLSRSSVSSDGICSPESSFDRRLYPFLGSSEQPITLCLRFLPRPRMEVEQTCRGHTLTSESSHERNLGCAKRGQYRTWPGGEAGEREAWLPVSRKTPARSSSGGPGGRVQGVMGTTIAIAVPVTSITLTGVQKQVAVHSVRL